MPPSSNDSPPWLHVFTYKDGLLSRLAHDLQLRCDRWEATFRRGQVRAEIFPKAIAVEGAIQNGRLDRERLSASDRRRVRDTIDAEVLALHRFSTIHFEGQARSLGPERWLVAGQLDLHGGSQAIELAVAREGDRIDVQCELVPSRWGIAPYRALGGALRVQDRIGIRANLPWPSACNARPWSDAELRWVVDGDAWHCELLPASTDT